MHRRNACVDASDVISVVAAAVELAPPRVLPDPARPLDETDAVRASLTVLALLTHRAGFAYHFTATGPWAEAISHGSRLRAPRVDAIDD